MLYSEGFDLEIALELGQLINNAYQQYEQRRRHIWRLASLQY